MTLESGSCHLQENCSSCLQNPECIFVVLFSIIGMCKYKAQDPGNGARTGVIYEAKFCPPKLEIPPPEKQAKSRNDLKYDDLDFGPVTPWGMSVAQKIREWKIAAHYLYEHPLEDDEKHEQEALIINVVTRLDYQVSIFVYNVSGNLQVDWNDHRLAWSPLEIENSNIMLRYNTDEVWSPRIGIKNHTLNLVSTPKSLWVDDRGKVLMNLNFTLANICQLNESISVWSHDIYTCSFTLVLESHKGRNLYAVFTTRENPLSDEIEIPNPMGRCEMDSWLRNFAGRKAASSSKIVEFPIFFNIRHQLSVYQMIFRWVAGSFN